MSVLPALQDDSIISLNTTMSNPSQLPPTGETSITNLPRWTVPLSKLVSLDVLLSHQRQSDRGRVHLIVCVTGTTAPVQRRTKEQRARGMDGTLWLAKWEVVTPGTAGKEVGCEVRLWDKCALDYGDTVRRGDVLLIEREYAWWSLGRLTDIRRRIQTGHTERQGAIDTVVLDTSAACDGSVPHCPAIHRQYRICSSLTPTRRCQNSPRGQGVAAGPPHGT